MDIDADQIVREVADTMRSAKTELVLQYIQANPDYRRVGLFKRVVRLVEAGEKIGISVIDRFWYSRDQHDLMVCGGYPGPYYPENYVGYVGRKTYDVIRQAISYIEASQAKKAAINALPPSPWFEFCH